MLKNLTLAVFLAAVSTVAFADDTGKVAKEQAKRTVKKTEKEMKKAGNKFTRFWTDDVGKTIYRGLKKGSGKIANTFD
jgi:gas vesicle protein